MAGIPPIIANTDFGQWQNWEQVNDPSGNSSYFVVPGYGGKYVYDPYRSQATGQITLYENPKAVYDAAAKAQAQQDKANSAGTQLATLGGTVAGLGTTALVSDAVAADKFSESLLGKGIDSITGGGAGAPSVATPGVSGGAAPEILSASRLPGEAAGSVGTQGAEAATWAARNPLLGGAAGAFGLALGSKGVYDAYEKGDPVTGGISGAGAGLGASLLAQSLGYSALGPWGWGVGLAIGLGAGLLGGRESGRDKIKKRIGALQEQGVQLPDFLLDNPQEYGKSKEELVQREAANQSEGQWGNPIFAESRDEGDLTGFDTWGSLPWFEAKGNEYLGATNEQQRYEMNRIANERGLFSEGNGALHADSKALSQVYDEVMSRPVEELPPVPDADTALSQRRNALPETREAEVAKPENIDEMASILAQKMDGKEPLGKGKQVTYFSR